MKWPLLILIVLLTLGAGVVIVRDLQKKPLPLAPNEINSTPAIIQESTDTLTIRGTVTAIQDNCIADGMCYVTIGDIKVITKQFTSAPPGGPAPPVGSHGGPALYVGSKAEAYGRKVGPKVITLIGSKEYYTKSLD